VNVEGTAALAEMAHRAGARFLHVSTDLVFDGEKGSYREADAPAPLSVYGQTKAEAEKDVLACSGTVVRLSLLFGLTLVGRTSFFDNQVDALRAEQPLTLFEDEWRTPLSLAAAARALLEIARSGFSGLLHLGGPERMSRVEMGQRLADHLGCRSDTIDKARRESMPAPEPRPRDTSLDASLWRKEFPRAAWPGFSEALRELWEP
jgi:dTDP-4-dehydrorhamnose reductase